MKIFIPDSTMMQKFISLIFVIFLGLVPACDSQYFSGANYWNDRYSAHGINYDSKYMVITALIDFCLAPTIAVFQLYHGVGIIDTQHME